MKVYIIEEGCQYEGFGIVKVYERAHDAIEAGEKIVADARYRKYKRDVLTLSEIERGVIAAWSDGSDAMIITGYEVVNDSIGYW